MEYLIYSHTNEKLSVCLFVKDVHLMWKCVTTCHECSFNEVTHTAQLLVGECGEIEYLIYSHTNTYVA